ncbi:SDR family oxidoreductase [Arsenicitalea aurantiaca]|uniref:SDR family oxidoreductase n=1 Tax=Arsenicitalea aurantiaca TaxID=1783274 RepID=A0A433XL48_9HYPH|nr:SDR family oxidoreductase [Arsenicitalea aurantiaca]RUT34793.1 SDR family oxidoreductase [Arsenicitalea aurantiaca]
MIDIDLSGHVAMVTGSSRGIGRASALLLAKAGARVVINYKSNREAGERTVAEIEAAGSEALLVQCDVGDTSSIAAMAEAGQARFGTIDILVNNAGGGIAKPADQLSDDEYEYVFDVNVRAYVAAARAVLPAMKAAGWGRIICISSVAGRSGKAFIGTSPAYAGAKGAVISYSRSMARECGPFGITVNTICPGWIDWEGKGRVVDPDLRAGAIAQMPMGRVGSDADVAGSVLFLASDYASYITGVALDVNGGLYMA